MKAGIPYGFLYNYDVLYSAFSGTDVFEKEVIQNLISCYLKKN
ncbi:hypothetical protein ACSAZL_10150 [Methanosarcina sp. T3]